MSQRPDFIAVLLQTYGRKDGYGSHMERPGIPRQALAIHGHLEEISRARTDGQKFRALWYCEYARRVHGLHSLPRLQRLLVSYKKAGITGRILIADLGRLYGRIDRSTKERMQSELNAYSEQIFEIKTGRTLGNLPLGYDFHLYYVGENLRLDRLKPAPRQSSPVSESRALGLRAARRKSLRSRAAQADLCAQSLGALGEEMKGGGTAPSHAALARAANARGLRSSRGNPWTGKAASRAMKRLADAEPG